MGTSGRAAVLRNQTQITREIQVTSDFFVIFQVNYLNDFLPNSISVFIAYNRDANQSKKQIPQYLRSGGITSTTRFHVGVKYKETHLDTWLAKPASDDTANC